MKRNFAKKRNVLVPALLTGIISASSFTTTMLSASAAKIASSSIAEQIFEVCQYQCAVDGADLTNTEEKELMVEIDETINEYALENGYTYIEAGEKILAEMIAETGYGMQADVGIAPCGSSGSKKSGDTELPPSVKGDIFFTDNDKFWNHVGMYTSSITIIEAMPDPGVHEVKITDPDALQETTGKSHDDSCILRVKNITGTQIQNAIDWARLQVDKPYDREFLNNKKNTEKENEKFNCSELVWKSFKFGAGIDLDSNGGAAVYPNNIYHSSKVVKVK